MNNVSYRKYVTTALFAVTALGVATGIVSAAEVDMLAANEISGLNSFTSGAAGASDFTILSPAALLFGGAIGAILWLGRQRDGDRSNWE